MSKTVAVNSLLIDIEAELRQLNLWQYEPPSAQALASVEPFCVDTLNFSQWLQFVFLPRMYQLLQQHQPLPCSCSIAPMAEEYFNQLHLRQAKSLIAALAALDQLLTEA